MGGKGKFVFAGLLIVVAVAYLIILLPDLAAYSHSASVGRRYFFLPDLFNL